MRKPRKNLAIFIIVKAAVETLFVVFLVLNFHQRAFKTRFGGRIGEASERKIAGWIVDQDAPMNSPEVQLYINDQFVASQIAARPRRDSMNAGGAANEARNFEFDLAPRPDGEYEARVYVVRNSGGGARRTLQILQEPVRFRVDASLKRR